MSPKTFHFLFPQHESGNLSRRPKEEARSNAPARDAFCNIDRHADAQPRTPPPIQPPPPPHPANPAECDRNTGGELVETKHGVAARDTTAGASQTLFLRRNDNLPSFPPALEEGQCRAGALSACRGLSQQQRVNTSDRSDHLIKTLQTHARSLRGAVRRYLPLSVRAA